MPTVESTVLTICSGTCLIRRGASENLFSAVSIFVLRPRLLYALVSREKEGGDEGVFFSRFAELSWFCVRRSIRDMGIAYVRYSRSNRALGVSGSTCTCGACFVWPTYLFFFPVYEVMLNV